MKMIGVVNTAAIKIKITEENFFLSFHFLDFGPRSYEANAPMNLFIAFQSHDLVLLHSF